MSAPWTERDLHRLARMVERGAPFDRIGEKLGRSASACSARAGCKSGPRAPTVPQPTAALDIPRHLWQRWTPEEDAIIRDRGDTAYAALVARLPGRTLYAINRRASAIGAVGHNEWTPEEDEAIRSRGTTTHKAVAVYLGRTESAVSNRAQVIGAQQRTRRATPARPWTTEDDSQLDALLWRGATRGEIAVALDRSESAIKQRTGNADAVRKWTPEEDEAIRSRGTATHAEVATQLGRTRGAVTTRAHSIGATGAYSAKWTPEDDDRLIAFRAEELTAKVIGERLGRTAGSVCRRVGVLGLSRWAPGGRQKSHCKRGHPLSGPDSEVRVQGNSRRCCKCARERYRLTRATPASGPSSWTPEEDEGLRTLWNAGERVAQISELLGRSETSIRARISRHRERLGLVAAKGRRVFSK